jgi:hypothetical protein
LTWPPDQTNDASQEPCRRIPTNPATRPEAPGSMRTSATGPIRGLVHLGRGRLR